MSLAVEFCFFDRIDYLAGIDLQIAAWEKVRKGGPDVCLVLEHNPTVTLGKNALESDLLGVPDGIEVVRTDRGGKVTGHEPGQLVVYPIVDLRRRKLTVRSYVALLQDAVRITLAEYGLVGGCDCGVGVWVNGSKICAMGIRVKRGVSMHGIALNVCNSMEVFQWIVPCGVKGGQVTSISHETGREVVLAEVSQAFVLTLTEQLQKVPVLQV